MTSAVKRSSLPLRDVLYEFSLAKDLPDAELIDEFVGRYPEFAGAITDYAVEIVLDALRTKEPEVAENPSVVSASVSRAMSKYQNALFAKTKAKSAVGQTSEANEVKSLFDSLDRKGFRAIASKMNVTNVFLIKLRDRQIVARTMSNGFRDFVAEMWQVARSAVDSYFAEPTPTLAVMFYKADAKPEVTTQQTFAEAVKTSQLDEKQQQFLLGL